jgi:hypothetical protein
VYLCNCSAMSIGTSKISNQYHQKHPEVYI